MEWNGIINLFHSPHARHGWLTERYKDAKIQKAGQYRDRGILRQLLRRRSGMGYRFAG
jgi:hypothetical protein